MSFISEFEGRIGSIFGAAPQGYTEPFSFKKLAKQAAREMERETLTERGVHTAPALYTVLISSYDDTLMGPLYPQITEELASFVNRQARKKNYRFVGAPLVRFVVDPSLKSGQFAVFAENIEARYLENLRLEEQEYLRTNGRVGGAAADMSRKHTGADSSIPSAPAPIAQPAYSSPEPGFAEAPVPTPRMRSQLPTIDAETALESLAAPTPDSFGGLAAGAVAGAAVATGAEVAAGLGRATLESAVPQVPGFDSLAAHTPTPPDAPFMPATQLRGVPLVNARKATHFSADLDLAPTPVATGAAYGDAPCILIETQTGRTHHVQAPGAILGRETSQATVVLRDPNISRAHARLSFAGGYWSITDLNSTNGTKVNDVTVHDCILRDGDFITLGLLNLEFREPRR